MIPWLLVAELLCLKNSSLKSLVADRQRRSPASGEINRKLRNAAEAIARIRRSMSRRLQYRTQRTGSVLNTLNGALTCARLTPSRWCV